MDIFFSNSGKEIDRNIFAEYNSPIIVIHMNITNKKWYEWRHYHRDENPAMEINPPLYEYEFIKQMDPFTIYQELGMFMDNVLQNPPPETLQISDKHLITGKGFDYKTSFRMAPGTKKPRRRKRTHE